MQLNSPQASTEYSYVLEKEFETMALVAWQKKKTVIFKNCVYIFHTEAI